MSILTQMASIERHGIRADLDALAGILDTTPATIRRKISDGSFPIPTYVDGGRRWADTRDVAAYLDQRREDARQAHHAGLPA